MFYLFVVKWVATCVLDSSQQKRERKIAQKKTQQTYLIITEYLKPQSAIKKYLSYLSEIGFNRIKLVFNVLNKYAPVFKLT